MRVSTVSAVGGLKLGHAVSGQDKGKAFSAEAAEGIVLGNELPGTVGEGTDEGMCSMGGTWDGAGMQERKKICCRRATRRIHETGQ